MSQENVQVLILPFEVNAPDVDEDLTDRIWSVLAGQLEEAGVAVVESGPSQQPVRGSAGEMGLKERRSLGRSVDANFVIWGSYTQIGRHHSLDAKIVQSNGETLPEAIYVDGEGIETLPDSVRRLGRDISMKIFHREKVADVLIEGNKRIEAEAIKRVIKTEKGDVYLAKHIQDDVKSIFRMGYFGDVQVDASSIPEGKVVTFRVEEKETVRNIKIKGNKEFDDEKVTEIAHVRPGSVLNVNTLQVALRQIENMYKEEGYHHVEVRYEITPVSENQADLDFIIDEGEKAFVKTISFEGNRAFDSDTLRDLMQTKEKGFFSWFTSSGELDPEVLEQDVSRITAYYHNHGYIQAKGGEPDLTYDKNWIHVTIKVEEGPQYKVGKVDVEGALIQPKEILLEKIQIGKEEVYNREVIRQDILTLGDIYADAGYAHADVSPRITENPKELKTDITYVIEKGPLVYFERIIIAGNTKTRDKVIRRELKVYEQELFSGKRLKRGARNLHRLDFFEDVKINTIEGSAEDKTILKIDVTEKPTGAFSFGGGYSSVDEVFFMASITQRNFLGRGQTLGLTAQLGGRTNRFTFSFTEPYLFDTLLTAGVDLYNTTFDYDTYDKDSTGGTLRCSYPVYDYTRVSFSYNYDKSDIRNLTDDVSSAVRDLEGSNVAHTLATVLRRDSRDRAYQATQGSDNSISIEHAGTPFGGDIGFTKYVADSGWYFPLFWDTVGLLHGRIGFIHGDPAGSVPTWERFYLGGMGSVRGYDWRDISPKDPETGDEIGGNKMLQFNAEFMFPLIKDAGFQGVLFYDTGMAYDNGEKLDLGVLRRSTGAGIRWYSPMGPISLDYGYILDDEQDQKGEGRWEFTMGASF